MARAFWETLYKRFDPEEPARDHQWRAERPNSPRKAMLAGLDRPFEPKKYLLLGTVGTGKTTELLAIAEEQAQRRMVIFLDVRRHFVESVRDPAALDHVQPWEVLLLIGLAVYRAALDSFGQAWADQHIRRLQESLAASAGKLDQGDGEQPAINLAQLASGLAVLVGGAVGGLAGAGLKLLEKAAEATSWSFRLGRRKDKRTDQDPLVLGLLNAVNGLIGTVQQEHQQLVIVLDGLDRIEPTETARDLFVESTLLSSMVCRTIVTGPITVAREGMGGQVRRFETQVLANAPVLDHGKPQEQGRGVEFMLDIYRRRVTGLDGGAIPEPLLRRLAYYSGGRGRDFVRLVRMTAERAWDRDCAVVDEALVGGAIDELRRLLELGINSGHIALLQSVIADPAHRLPDDDKVAKLLERFWLLPYPNQSEWYFPHPLLTIELVRLASG